MKHLPWRRWRHLTKVDPDKPLPLPAAAAVLASGTDAIVIGGTDNIEAEAVTALLARLTGRGVPCLIEVSSPACLVHGADGYLIPVVLNAGDPLWLTGLHQAAVRWAAEPLPWHLALTEGYIVGNADSAVARLTSARIPEGPHDVAAWATVAEKVLGLSLVYVEYSGRFADPAVVAAARQAVAKAHVVYGGGITTAADAARMAAVADTVVVGNLVHSDWTSLAATVSAVKRTAPPGARQVAP